MKRPLLKEKNKTVSAVIKDNLGGKLLKEFIGLRAKTYSYLTDHNSEEKKAKGTKQCAIKRKLKFKEYKNCLEATQLENQTNHPKKTEIDIDSLKTNHKEFTKQ